MTSLYDEVKKNPKYNPNNSVNWFRQNVTDHFRNLGQMQFMDRNKMFQTRMVVPGDMCFFGYDPKYKQELPYYDKFPLILPFSVDAKHFIGINLHYLPPPVRIRILDKLIMTATDKDIPDKMKVQVSWKILSALSENKAIQHSVKKYLIGHVKTRFITVPTKEWPIAVFLPLARFAKADEATVWRGIK
jgi:hypothetical protein